MAREVNADEPVVASVQYLRVVFVVATVSVVAPVIGGDIRPGSVPAGSENWRAALAFVALSLAVGLFLAAKFTFSGSRLLIPMSLAVIASVTHVFPSTHVPNWAMDVGYAITGLAVGLSFSKGTLLLLRRLAPLIAGQLVIGVVGCALVGLGFSELTGATPLDGYLATTPAGLPAVTAIAVSSAANVGLVATMQIARMFSALLVAAVVSWVVRRRSLRWPAGRS